jgi:hypothetical protein
LNQELGALLVESNLRVLVQLPRGWFDHSKENPGGPSLYCRHLSKCPGALQISLAEYKHGRIPNMTPLTLINIAKSVGSNFGHAVEEVSGKCVLGDFGSVLFHSDRIARAQVWCLTDGNVAVLVSHVCENPPDAVEIAEVEGIVQRLRITEDAEKPAIRPWWQFWKCNEK